MVQLAAREGRGRGLTHQRLTPADRAKVCLERPGTVVVLRPNGGLPPSKFLPTVPGRSGQAYIEAMAEEVPNVSGWRCGLWLAPFPLLPRGRALRGTWDGPQGWAGLRQGLCSGGLRLAPGDTLRLCDRALEGRRSADEGSGQVPAAALGLFLSSPTRVSETNPLGLVWRGLM